MMKSILFVCHTNPFSASFGAEQRTALLLNAFLQNNCKIDIVYVGREQIRSIPTNPNIRVRLNGVTNYHPSFITKVKFKLCLIPFITCQRISEFIDKLDKQNNYDYIVCRYIDVAELAGLWKHRAKMLLDIDDLPHKAYKSILHANMMSTKFRLYLMKSATNKWIKYAKSCFLPDKNSAQEYGISYFPNIPVIQTQQAVLCEQNILFIGRLDWKPNIDGLVHFIENCWAKIINNCPNTIFYIAGKGLSIDVQNYISSYPNIKLLGFVSDIYDFYQKGNIVIAPIYSGAGTNIKVIEAMAMAKACVITPCATRGFEHILKDKVNVLIAPNDEEFIRNVVNLIDNKEKVLDLSKSAKETVGVEYSQAFLNSIIKEHIYG